MIYLFNFANTKENEAISLLLLPCEVKSKGRFVHNGITVETPLLFTSDRIVDDVLYNL